MLSQMRRARCALLTLLLVTLVIGVNPFIPSVAHAAGTITGTIFRDFNANGVQDAAETTGVAGITVTAYDAANAPQGSTITAANGTYTLNAIGTGPYRIEFTTLPSYLQPSAIGTSNASTIQFVPDGNSTNINLGLNDPSDYSQPNPRIAVPVLRGGSNAGSSNTGLISDLYGSAVDADPGRIDATLGQIGATWGEGYQRVEHRLFVAANVKRYSGFGPQGPGGVYVLDYSNAAAASLVRSFTLQGVTPANGGAAIDLGTVTRTNVAGAIAAGAAGDYQLPANGTQPSRDLDAFNKAAKVSYGDTDVDETGKTLWLVNLNQRALITVDISGASGALPGTVNQYPIIGQAGVPTCTNGNLRPWALKFYHGLGYLGAVCDASVSQQNTDLAAYVLSFDPANPAAGFTQQLMVPLDPTSITREATEGAGLSPTSNPNTYSAIWRAWADTWAQTGLPTATGGRLSFAEPILSDIEFTPDGAMTLGFSNRFASQSGNFNYIAVSGSTTTYNINNAGDIIKACLVGNAFVLESYAGCPVNDQGATRTDGFSHTGEFYWGDFYDNTAQGGSLHSEIAGGALAIKPGTNEIISTGFDTTYVGPTSGVFGQGVLFLNTTAGSKNRGWQIDTDPTYGDPSHYAKGNGLGDVELLADPAPIEVGNRVWRDTNGNGVQDAGEPGLANVVIGLYNATGTLIDTVTTDSTGTYLFSSAAGTDALGRNYGVNLQPNTSYTVAVLSSNLAAGGTLAGYQTTTANVGGNTSNQEAGGATPDLTDSDGVAVTVGTGTNSATLGVTFTTGASGFNNHSLDFGVIAPVSIGNQVWYDTNNNSSIDAGEAGVDGVVVNLFLDADNSGTLTGAEQTPVATQTTTNGGYYLFTRDSTGVMLNPGTYIVGIAPANFVTGGVLVGSRSSGTTITNAGVVSDATLAATTNTNGDNADDGVSQTTGFYPGGVLSGPLVVTAGGEPTGELATGQAAGTGGTTPSHPNTIDGTGSGVAIPDANSNLTVDFGFYRQTLGDQIFHDVTNNGTYDGGDAPLAGATVQLYAANGTTEVLVGPDGILGTADDAAGGVTTTATGTYLFQNLPQGQYIVKVTPPAGYTSSTDLASSGTPNGNVNNDDNGVGSAQGQVSSSAITLTPGSTGTLGNNTVTAATGTTVNPTLDFGFYTLSIGNLVWNDTNNNGVLDGLEAGIDGVTVNLYQDTNGSGTLNAGDTLVGVPQVTSNGGHYLFTGLPPGTYFVQLAPSNFQAGGTLLGYQSSTGANGALTGPYEPGKAGAVDNDDNGTTGTGGLATAGVTGGIASGPIVLAAGTQPTGETDLGTPTGVTNTATDANSNLSIDFGVYQSAALGDFVWFDTNKNGVQDAGESGVNGVQVSLYTPNGADGVAGTPDDTLPIATTITAPNGAIDGSYHFANLVPNTMYTVKLDRASDFAAGGPLAGYTLTAADQGGNDALDSDATLVGGVPTITATTGGPGSDIPTYDFGFNTSASLGDYVWLDANNNGVQDAGEAGINGVTVNLYDSTGTTLLDTTKTVTNGSTQGYYHFANLTPGTTYQVKLNNPADFMGTGPLANTQLSPVDQGGNDTTDSDATLVGGFPTIAVAPTGGPGTDTPTYDIGFYRPSASVGDYVWNDANKNGVQDASEVGINGVTVHLYDSTGTTLLDTKITTTNGGTTGYYHFDNLVPNTSYVIKLDNPADYTPSGPLAGFTLTPADQGGNDATDSDASLVGGYPTISTATTGGNRSDTPTYDIGLYQPLSIGNLVWNDINNNGVVDAGEAGVNGVTVVLYRDTDGSGTLTAADTVVTSQLTSNGGHYFFGDLGQGSYLVQLAPSNFQTGGALAGYTSSVGAYAPTGPYEPGATTIADNDDNGTILAQGGIVSNLVVLAPGTQPTNEPDGALPTGITNTSRDANSNLTIDFGVFQPAQLGSVVWNDQNSDGVRQPSEPGVAGVTVTLYNAAGNPVATTTTDSNGGYQFVNLPPGTYTVGFSNLPPGFVFTTPNQGNDATDSDVNMGTGQTAPITLVPSDNVPTIFAGITSNPTAVTLTRFTATWQGRTVAVAWTTSAEVNTFGFRLYRSVTDQRADAVQVTTTLIAAQGRGQGGARYTWTDTTANPGTVYRYWLEETEVSGTTHTYGPARLGATTTQRTQAQARLFLPVITR